MVYKGEQVVQTTIPIDRGNSANFSNFHAQDNQQTLTLLQDFLNDEKLCGSCYIWGARGTGKSHLLYASCKQILSSVYIPLMDLQLKPDVLTAVINFRLVCIDDIDAVACQTDWESHLLILLENTEKNGNLLVLTGNRPPVELDFESNDLVNRLQGRRVFKLSSASDQTKVRMLVDRANERGLTVETSVAEFILRRHARDTHSLMRLFDRIAQASLENRRRITIPFLRELDEFKFD